MRKFAAKEKASRVKAGGGPTLEGLRNAVHGIIITIMIIIITIIMLITITITRIRIMIIIMVMSGCRLRRAFRHRQATMFTSMPMPETAVQSLHCACMYKYIYI